MSNSGGNESSHSNHRIEPSFFGSPSLYQDNGHDNKKSKSVLMPPPGAENPYWKPEDQLPPPPPYTQTPSEPASSSSMSINQPSAPPLEEEQNTTSDYSIGNIGGFIRPPQQQHSNSYPRYHQYGSIPTQYNNTGDVPWPWNVPPSATGQALLIYPSTQPPLQPKKEKSCFEKFFKFIFYFLILCVILRLLGLINGFVTYNGSCSSGVSWGALPKQFTFDETLIIRVASGSITSGHITLKSITDKDIEEEKLSEYGLVKTTTHISPSSLLDHPDLTYTLTNWSNGTVLEIYIPHEISGGRSCVNFDATIYVPKNAVNIVVEVQNSRIEVLDETIEADRLCLTTTNKGINFYPQWKGKQLVLVSKNGAIELNRPIEALKELVVLTTNGALRARDTVKAGDAAIFTTTNAAVEFDKLVDAYALQVTSTNGRIMTKSIIAEAAEIKTSNARITVEQANIKRLLSIQSSNAQVDITVDQGLFNGEAVVRTSNGRARLSMPSNYEGLFEMSTSSSSKVNLIDPLGWSHINMKNNHVSGSRYSPNNTNRNDKGHVQVITSNAEVSLEFAKE